MFDTYQAVYDAVRSRICNGDVGRAVREIAMNALDISHSVEMVRCDFQVVAYDMQRPSVLFKPRLSIDGDQWCALYGEDIQNGVTGFGASPALAMADFDENWNKPLTNLVKSCKHMKIHYEDWPDGGGIEVCDECRMSRYIWEQGESSWVMVDDITKARKELGKYLKEINDFE